MRDRWVYLVEVNACYLLFPFSNLENLGEVEYPIILMGAYSSWVMLILSHHVIIQYSAILAGHRGYINYAVLGDDGLKRPNRPGIREGYETARSSGFYGKSVVSTRFTEFTKELRRPGIDFSPIWGRSRTFSLQKWYNVSTVILGSSR
jgi:hypothetical protein